MIASYHTHTIWSDGHAAVANMIQAAERDGVEELGVSDHFTLDPAGRKYDWALQHDQLRYYVEEIVRLRSQSSVSVRLGLEVDWFAGHGEAIKSALADFPFDYLLGAVHLVEGKQFGNDPAWWQAMPEHELARRHTLYWTLIAEMARSRLFDIVAHIDLPKIHGILPSADLSPIIAEALDAIAAAGMIVELNTAGWSRPCADAYPSMEILQACRRRGIDVTLSSDAHHPDYLTNEFERGTARLREAGFERIARFRNRERWFEPLPVPMGTW